MLIEKPKKKKDTIATRILTTARDYGMGNPQGEIFDRLFNREQTDRDVSISRHAVGQSKQEIQYPNGMSPDGGSMFSPSLAANVELLDPKRALDGTAENQVHLYWKKNRERSLKYYRVAGRAEVVEALNQITDEAMYPNSLNEICSLSIDTDAEIGEAVKSKLHKIFRRDLLRGIMRFGETAWTLFRSMLIEGRIFLEVVFDPTTNKIIATNLLPSQNMIIIVQNGVILGYRQMLEGAYTNPEDMGKNYRDFSPNQILYADLGMYGPGGINDPRSPLEPAIKAFNQLNAIEDAVTMYRIQWGSEKLLFKIDTGTMARPKAEKHLQDQANLLSRRVEYNSTTGEVGSYGKVIGLGEHWFMSVSNQATNSSIERISGGENLSNIDDLKYFKRNLVNCMFVPPGRVTALAGDAENFSSGKVSEVTQAEVAFARMVQRYQQPFAKILRRLFVMVLNTHKDIAKEIKIEENFTVIFNKSNGFQNYIDADIQRTNLEIFDAYIAKTKTEDNPAGVLSIEYALRHGLKLSDSDISKIREQIKEEERRRDEEDE